MPGVAQRRQRIEQRDLDAFAELSGDDNPIHVDPPAATASAFGVTVAHGTLLAALLDGLVRETVGWEWRAAALTFPAPVPAGSDVELSVVPSQSRAEVLVATGGDPGCTGVAAAAPGLLPPEALQVPAARAAPEGGAWSALVGCAAGAERTFEQAELARYAALARTPPGAVELVPLPLVAALFSFLLGTRLPGPGTHCLKQSIALDAVPGPGTPLLARVEVTRVRPAKGLVDLATTCTTTDRASVARGRALVSAREADLDAAVARAMIRTDPPEGGP